MEQHKGGDDAPAQAAEVRRPRGIQSVEVGGRLLVALVHLGRPLALKDLAREAGMSAAKAHPYLVSFGALGLIAQDAASGRYGLGPLALQMGLISLHQADPIRLASAELPALAQQIGHTVGVAIWGNRGPTFVRLEEGPAAVHVNMRHGTVVSVQGTAAGRLFSAFMDAERRAQVLRQSGEPATAAALARFERELKGVRTQRFAAVVDGTVPGITAIAAPVFDGFGTLVLALTAIGPGATLDASADGRPGRLLRHAAWELSQRLGALRPAPV